MGPHYGGVNQNRPLQRRIVISHPANASTIRSRNPSAAYLRLRLPCQRRLGPPASARREPSSSRRHDKGLITPTQTRLWRWSSWLDQAWGGRRS